MAFTIVDYAQPLQVRRALADRLRILPRTHGETYDFGVYAPTDPDRERLKTTAFLIVRDQRIVGAAVVHSYERSRVMSTADLLAVSVGVEGDEQPLDGGPRPALFYIWLHPSLRNSGLVDEFLGAIAVHYSIRLSELGWMPDFSADARKLIARLCADSYYEGFYTPPAARAKAW